MVMLDLEVASAASLEKYLDALSVKLTAAVRKASRSLGLRPPRRVVLSLRSFRERDVDRFYEEYPRELPRGARGDVCGFYDCARQEIVVSLACVGREGNRKGALIRTLAHELVHHCQHVGGPVCSLHYTCEDLRRVNLELPYWLRPHEVEAYRREEPVEQRLAHLLAQAVERVLAALDIKLEIHNPPPLRANLLFVEPGGKAELRGPGHVAELRGQVKLEAPVLVHWLNDVAPSHGEIVKFNSLKGVSIIEIDLVKGIPSDVEVVFGDLAAELYHVLKEKYRLDMRGEVIDKSWEFNWVLYKESDEISVYNDYVEVEESYPSTLSDKDFNTMYPIRVLIGRKTSTSDELIARKEKKTASEYAAWYEERKRLISKLLEELERSKKRSVELTLKLNTPSSEGRVETTQQETPSVSSSGGQETSQESDTSSDKKASG